MRPTWTPKGALEASQRPLGAESGFRKLFGVILDPPKSSKMELKVNKKSSADLEVSFWLFGSLWGSFGARFGGHFGLHFETPEPLKIVLSLWRGTTFCKNGMTRPGAQNGAQHDPQIEPQTTPRGLQIAKKIPPNRRLMFGQISFQFWSILGAKSTLKPLSAPKGRLEASRAPFGWHLGSMLVSF